MYVRKLQLVAGTTYTVSLPKAWVQENGLKEQSNVSMVVRGDRNLLVMPRTQPAEQAESHYDLNIDDYGIDIDQVLFALFYSGFETITLHSAKRISPSMKSLIKRTLSYMSGTEIVYEDDEQVQLKVLLAPEKLDIAQVFFRISLIISETVAVIKGGGERGPVEVNEIEVDRLYHLIVKIISLSLNKAELRRSTGVDYTCNVLPYFLIAKRLEHLGDNLYRLTQHLRKDARQLAPVLDFIDKSVRRSVEHLRSRGHGLFTRTDPKRIATVHEQLDRLRGDAVRRYLGEALRCAEDVEEELLNLTFYRGLVRDGLL